MAAPTPAASALTLPEDAVDDVPVLQFAGNPTDYRRVLALAQLHFEANPEKYSTDAAKIAHFVGYFRGAALDWYVARVAASATGVPGLGNFGQFRTLVEGAFALGANQEQAALVTRLQHLRCGSDILGFVAEFQSITEAIGTRSDASRIALVKPMLPMWIQQQIAAGGMIFHSWISFREYLQNVACLLPPRQAARPAKAKRCSKCGKTGHRAKNCKTGN